ncbi:MAG: ACT domain-containing protein [Anaerolineales bacterium]
MTIKKLSLSSIPERFAVCQIDRQAKIPDWAFAGEFFFISCTPDELSIICPAQFVPPDIQYVAGWRGLKIEGPFDFNEIGVLAAITAPLARGDISLLTVSTFDTDYIFLQEAQFETAVDILEAVGHKIDAIEKSFDE